MQTQQIVVDRAEARALYRKYREHQHYSTPIDWLPGWWGAQDYDRSAPRHEPEVNRN